eukprot:4682-Heterococcus_DN1.PRE.6
MHSACDMSVVKEASACFGASPFKLSSFFLPLWDWTARCRAYAWTKENNNSSSSAHVVGGYASPLKPLNSVSDVSHACTADCGAAAAAIRAPFPRCSMFGVGHLIIAQAKAGKSAEFSKILLSTRSVAAHTLSLFWA